MVARIKIGSALTRGFYYNESKVKQGVATCLMAANYPAPLERMNEMQRLCVLQKVASLRESLKANSVHISLNFDPSEKLSADKLRQIGTAYMEQIGFAKQPYLIYEHRDAGHPHIHILTTKVDFEGKAINTNFIARDKSEPARKELEIRFALVKAGQHQDSNYKIKSAYTQKVNYGKMESRRAIATVLEEVLNTYKYTSLPELNALLALYNIRADRGTEQSRTYKHNGLLYHILDNNGRSVGLPIKASSFPRRPTLAYLKSKFKANETSRLSDKARIKNAIDYYFLGSKVSLDGLIKSLEKEGINTILRHSESGQIYGVTYVDHKTKCVFNGSVLGKEYSAKAVQERAGIASVKKPDVEYASHKASAQEASTIIKRPISHPEKQDSNLLETLFRTEEASEYLPYELSGKRKKRKKSKPKS